MRPLHDLQTTFLTQGRDVAIGAICFSAHFVLFSLLSNYVAVHCTVRQAGSDTATADTTRDTDSVVSAVYCTILYVVLVLGSL